MHRSPGRRPSSRPASQADFDRNKSSSSALTNSLRSNDEALGLELLQDEIYQGHPYGHSPIGTVEGLKSITLDDVKAFYKQHFTPRAP